MSDQEPTEFDVGCFWHGFEGDIIPEKVPYLACGECGHLYWTERQLIDEFNSVMREARNNSPHMWLVEPVDVISGDEIYYCAWCAHDF